MMVANICHAAVPEEAWRDVRDKGRRILDSPVARHSMLKCEDHQFFFSHRLPGAAQCWIIGI
ncbi:hypothetical protein BDY19DRAFT_931406, partial [Irpex rosettiformis]